jgi:cytochrome c553
VVLLLAMAASPLAAQTAPPTPLPELLDQCQSCHGASGQPVNDEFPIIGGQNRAYLAAALRALRGGQRGGGNAEAMQPFAKDLTDEQIEALAAFFSTLRNLR